MLTPKTQKRPLRPKKASTTGAFSFELQDGDRIHFLSDTDCEVRRGQTVLGRYRHAYDDDTSDPLAKAVDRTTQMSLVPGMETKVKGPNTTSMGKKDDAPAVKPKTAKTRKEKPKADKPKKDHPPLQAGEQWLTLHPDKTNPDLYFRVKVRLHSDGTASVIGGADGKLNQLHLTKLKSPEEWEKNAKERKAKRAEKERKRQEAQSEDERAEEEGKVKEAREYHRNEKHQNALETLKALDEAGIDLGLSEKHRDALAVPPAPDTDPEEAKRVEALARDALKTVEKVHQAYEQKLVTDHEARAAAKLGDTALDGLGNPLQQGLDHSAYSADEGEISSITQLPNGQWLVRSPNGADQSFDEWEKAAKAHAGNVAEHDSTTGERSQEDDFYNPKLWVRQHEDLPEGFKFDVTVAGKIAALAQGRKEIDRSAKNAEKAIKKGQPWNAKKGADVQGTVIDDQAALAALESDAKTIEDAIVHGRLLDLADILNPKELKKHLGTGGLAQLGEIASDVLKANPVDPALVQQLGHNEAAKLLAYQIRQSMSEGEYEAVVAAQGVWHGEWSTRYAQEVIDRNQPLVDQLSAIHKRMLEIEQGKGGGGDEPTLDLFGGGDDAAPTEADYTPDELIELDNLAYQSRSLQDSLSKEIGTALGQLQASAAMTLALESRPRSLRFAVDGDNVAVEDVPGLFSRETPDGESKPSIWAHYGLGADDFDLQDGPDGQLVSVKPAGMEKLAGASYDPADREEYERAIAIKRGDFDQENFTPDGFAYRPAQTFADVRAEAQQFGVKFDYSPEMSDDELLESMKSYIGARVANGSDPLAVRADLMSPKLYATLGIKDAEVRAQEVLHKHEQANLKSDPTRTLSDLDILNGYRAMGDMEAARQRETNASLDAGAIHSQSLDPDTAKEAAHRALAAMPTAKAALKPLEQLNPRERKLLRDYAVSKLLKGSPDPHADASDDDDTLAAWEDETEEAPKPAAEEVEFSDEVAAMMAALNAPVAAAPQDNYTPNVKAAIQRFERAKKQATEKAERAFQAKGSSLTSQYQKGSLSEDAYKARWQEAVDAKDAAIAKKHAEIDDLQQKVIAGEVEPRQAAERVYKKPSPWNNFAQLMGGDAKAYEAIQDQIKGDFYHRFAGAYSSIQGNPLMMGTQPTAHSDRLLLATLPPDERGKLLEKMRSDTQSDIAAAMNRDKGKFATTADVMDRYNEMKGAKEEQGSLLGGMGLDEPEEEKPKDEIKPSSVFSRTMLGETAEQQLDDALAEVLPGFEQLDSAVNLYPEVRWNGGFVAHQRGLQFLQERKKIGMHYSAGCVHGSTLLRCHKTGLEQSFYDWWLSGERPWVLALDEPTGQTVVAPASPVFVKAYDQMYRVTLESGAVITVTGGHRFLGRGGWVKLSDLAMGDEIAIAQPMTEAHALSHRCHQPKAASASQSVVIAVPPSTLGDMPPETRHGLDVLSSGLTALRELQALQPFSWLLILRELKCRVFSSTWLLKFCPRLVDGQFASSSIFRLHTFGAKLRGQTLPVSIVDKIRQYALGGLSSSVHLEMQTVEGLTDRCSTYSRQYDEQPRPSLNSALDGLPSPSGVLAHTHEGWRWDGLGYKASDIRDLSKGFFALLSSWLAWLAPANISFRERFQGVLREKKITVDFQCRCSRDSRQCDELPLLAQGSVLGGLPSLGDALVHSFERSYGDDLGSGCEHSLVDQQNAVWAYSKISKIEPVGRSPVFDITVPDYQNYLAHGVWNHNSGKSAGMLGAFTHLHSQGVVQRSIIAVPSGIIGQIVGECATFIEPGKYNYSANMGWDREKRIEALKNPDLHLFFSTRESLANDLLHLVEKHTGVSSDDFQDTKARTEDDRRALMLTALQNEGIDPKSLLFSVDESHDLARRKGVAPSKRSLALDALAHHSGYHIAASGTPLKNDVSEIADFLQKVGAKEVEDMDGFMARYGKNTQANKRALQRIMGKYAYAIAVKPQTKDGQDLNMRHEKPRIPLTEYQKTQRQTMLGHYDTIRKWKQNNLKQAMAAKVERGDTTPLNGAALAHAWDDPGVREAIAALAPDGYDQMSDEEKQAAIGGQILGASAMKFTALSRLYHRAPYEHNAKAQHTVKMAEDMVAAGKPGVIFSASSEAAKMLQEEMAKKGIRVGLIDGSMSSEQKSKERLRFSPGKGVEPEVDILIATDAAQTGLNLQRGKFLAHYDVPLTQKAWDQRSARIYRRGQTEDVEVHTLMADAPEDEIALARMERKGGDSAVFHGHDATLGHAEVLDDSGLAAEIARQKALINQGGTDKQTPEQMAV